MAEDSAPWEGTTIGDAASTDVWSAPYSDDEWADIDSKLEQSNVAKGYIIPSYGNSLRVHANSPAALNVLVETGAIRIRGRLYELTAQSTQTVTAADATNPRIDRVVARITFASQTIRLAVLAGTPAATPSLPTLTQNATTYEISLAYIWVAALAASVAEAEIHDERVFAPNLEYAPFLSQENLIHNSEFMAFSDLDNATHTRAPDMWDLVLTPSNLTTATKPAQMSRGRAVQLTADASNEGISQTFRIKASTVYAIRALINVTAGDVGVIQITDNGASPATITRNIRRTGSFIEETIYYTTPSDATTIRVDLLCSASTDVVQFGQVLAVEGYSPGPFRQIHEIIPLVRPVDDASWTVTAKSDGDTTIDLDSDFGGIILPGTRSVFVGLQAYDSGSAGSGTILAVRSTKAATVIEWSVRLYFGLNTNNSIHVTNGWVPLDTNNQFVINVDASGAGTLFAYVYITAIMT